MLAGSLTHGFRFDAMDYAWSSDSLQAVLVRRQVLRRPNPGDDAVIAERVEAILAAQADDGWLGERGHQHSAALMELAECGVDPARAEVRAAVAASLRGVEGAPGPWVRDLQALPMLGVTDAPELRACLADVLAREDEWNDPWKLCPWGQVFYAIALWQARTVGDTVGVVRRILRKLLDGMNDAGCVAYKDPWGIVWAASRIDLPEARELLRREIPVILRGQERDGGWGDGPYDAWSRSSLSVFRALVRHGLFEDARDLPPLPPDWRVVREVTAPAGDLWTMAWDGASLWTLDRETHEAIALSPADGSVRKRVRVPFENATGLAWWDDGLAIAQAEPKRVVRLNPTSGDVERELPVSPDWIAVHDVACVGAEVWVSDARNSVITRLDPAGHGKHRFLATAGSQPLSICPTPDGLWHIDALAPLIVQTSLEGRKLLDWGEKPCGGRCDGLAWDGERMWALDSRSHRVCVIEKAR